MADGTGSMRDRSSGTVVPFMEALASPSPSPGGGAASAVVGALGCAQAQMVAALTAQNPRYAQVSDEMLACGDRLAESRSRFMELAEEDAVGYERVASALRLPRESLEEREARSATLAEALEAACKAPFEMFEVAARALDEVDYLSREGSAMAASDVICAASMLVACADGAGATVLANTPWMADKPTAQALEAHQARIRELVRLAGTEVTSRVERRLMA